MYKQRKKKLQQLQSLSNKLKSVYYDIEHPASFGSVKNLNESTGDQVRDWLLEQDAYTLHVPTRRKYKTNHYLVFGPNELYELDLIDLKNIARFNYGYKYILCVIDCFTKFLWATPLTDKTAGKTTEAFKKIIESSNQIPKTINMDRGSEFNNKIFKAYVNKIGIQLNFPYIQSYQKAAMVERVIRSIKEKMFKYFTSRGPTYRKYIDVLPKIIKSYNAKVHSTTKLAPVNFKLSDTVNVYNNIRNKTTSHDTTEPAKFMKGDFVRIVRKKSILEHGFTQRWTPEIFRIHNIIWKDPIPLYNLVDMENVPVNGKFYGSQLLKIKVSADTPIRILNERQTRTNKQLEVEMGDGTRMWLTEKEYNNKMIQ